MKLIFATFIFAQSLQAFECKVDPTMLAIAKATGGGVFCRESKKIIIDDPISFYDMDQISFQAFWKVLGHGSLDTFSYPAAQLPFDKVKVEVANFPSKIFEISKLYTEDKFGKKSDIAELLSDAEVGAGSDKKLRILRFKLKPNSKEFKLVIEGKTHLGTPYIQFSKTEYKTGSRSDKEQGLNVWSKIFESQASSKKPLSEDVKSKFLKDAFAE